MSTTTTQGWENHARPPPPYTVSPTGSSYLSTNRGYTNSPQEPKRDGRDETKFLTLMQLGSIIILVLCALSCIIALHRNTKLMEQNLDLLERQLKLLAKNRNTVDTDLNNYRVKRMIDPFDSCPPCPTEAPPNPIQPHMNPVSVLNEEVGQKAKYEVLYVCEDPHIHTATLKIVDDPSFTGKTWNGKGRNQQNAKQSAAWEAIQKDLPHLIQYVAEEHKPGLYNPICNNPPQISLGKNGTTT